MKYGARNRIVGKVTSVKSDEVMSLAKFEVEGPVEMASVLTTESVEELGLREGDEVRLVIRLARAAIAGGDCVQSRLHQRFAFLLR